MSDRDDNTGDISAVLAEATAQYQVYSELRQLAPHAGSIQQLTDRTTPEPVRDMDYPLGVVLQLDS